MGEHDHDIGVELLDGLVEEDGEAPSILEHGTEFELEQLELVDLVRVFARGAAAAGGGGGEFTQALFEILFLFCLFDNHFLFLKFDFDFCALCDF